MSDKIHKRRAHNPRRKRMRKVLIIAAVVAISGAAYAEGVTTPAATANPASATQTVKKDGNHKSGSAKGMTEEQKTCLANQNCQKPTSKTDKAGKKAYNTCMKTAKKTCGIQKANAKSDKTARAAKNAAFAIP